jgi:hypothetical protein
MDCRAANIPENIICGACGASLPVVYDKDGRVFRFETDSPYWAEHAKREKDGPGPNPVASVGFKAVGLLALFTVLVVLLKRFGFSAPLIFIAVLMGLIIAVRLFLHPRA